MATITAVELGADMCALARTAVRGGAVQLLAAETLDPAAFASLDAFTDAVRQTRKALKLPRRCRAVVWGLPDGAGRKHPAVKPLVAPLTGAGFRVERVISPCNALAALARLKMPRGEGATCWLAINRTGVAIVVVRPGKQLYSHSYAWDSNVGSSGSQARLLQRYTLVAFLTPEIRRAMLAARENGTAVDAIVTCGNLPDIRSLTMPLIEELDVEVESLDSLEGLIVKRDANDRLADAAASLRMACAGVIARPTRPPDESKRGASGRRSLGRIAAAVAVIAGVLVIGWTWWSVNTATPRVAKAVPPPKAPQQRAPAAAGSASSKAAPPMQPATSPNSAAPKTTTAITPHTTPPQQAAPQTVAPRPSPAPVTRESAPAGPPSTSAPSKRPQPNPAVTPPQPSNQRTASPPLGSSTSKTSPPAPSVARTAPKPIQPNPSATRSTPTTTDSNPPVSVPAAPSRGELNARPAAADKANAPSVRAPLPELLKDPVPRVTAILISSDRRMATIDDGRIIGVGDLLGRRRVVGIDERAVVLQEPSGVQIRVALGGKVIGVARSERQ
jgi:hypothetical protein